MSTRRPQALTAQQLRAALKRLGLSQVAAARLLGVDARTLRRWVLGEARVPVPVGLLLAAWERYPTLMPRRQP